VADIENVQNLYGQTRAEKASHSAFNALARELAAFDGLVVTNNTAQMAIAALTGPDPA
jgi:hypothetical protein